MPYIKEICVAGNTIEVSKYYSVRYHSKGASRAPNENTTPESVKRINNRNAIKNLRRLLNANFADGDYLVRLDFSKNVPKGSIDMQDMISKALRKLKRELKKDGKELKYVYVKEIGPRGGRHIHMVCNRCETEALRNCWPHGGIHIDPLCSNGQYSKIAEYFIKYSIKTEETEGELIGKRWYGARNLKKPSIKKKIITANRFRGDYMAPKGYYLDKESIRSGISDLTGYEYMSYTLIKAEMTGRCG